VYIGDVSGEVAAQANQYWELVPAIVGGVIGALAGGVPAWLIAKSQSDETLRRDSAERREAEKALAFRVCVKLLTIINSTISLRSHVKGCAALRSIPGNEKMELWQVLVPMIGHTDEGSIRFDAEEMAVFAAAKEHDFMQDALLLAQRHASSLASFQEYCKRREEFLVLAPRPEEYSGQLGSAMLTYDQILKMKPFTLPLNNIVAGLLTGLEEDLRLARKVSLAFGPIVKKRFADPNFTGLSFPSDEQLAAMILPPSTMVPGEGDVHPIN
jgi:hypothetical protein